MTTAREMLLDSMTPEEYNYTVNDKHVVGKMVATLAAGWLAGKLAEKAYDTAYWVAKNRGTEAIVEAVTD